MSVLIKGMEMPKSCESCKLLHDVFVHVSEDFDYFCYVTKSMINRSVHNDILGGRPENCPLVEVPTPHGRLADVVEVVRCKDCECYDTHDHRCKFFNHGIAENDYCSRGIERRKDEQIH